MIDILNFTFEALSQIKPFVQEYLPLCLGFGVIATIPIIIRKAVGIRK